MLSALLCMRPTASSPYCHRVQLPLPWPTSQRPVDRGAWRRQCTRAADNELARGAGLEPCLEPGLGDEDGLGVDGEEVVCCFPQDHVTLEGGVRADGEGVDADGVDGDGQDPGQHFCQVERGGGERLLLLRSRPAGMGRVGGWLLSAGGL